MDAISGISPALWGKFIALLAIFGAAMLIAGSVAMALTWRRRAFPALLVLAGAMGVPICLATAGFTMMSPYFSLAGEARAINREIASEPDALVACEAAPHTASSLYYYLNARVHWVNTPFDQDYAQRVLRLGRDSYWDDAELETSMAFLEPGLSHRGGKPARLLAGGASARSARGEQKRDAAGAGEPVMRDRPAQGLPDEIFF